MPDDHVGNDWKPLQTFSWKCSRPGCKKEIISYSQSGTDTLARIHLKEHDDEIAQNIREWEETNKKPKEVTDYNKLKITRFDAGFLKTRGVALDKDIEIVP